VVCDALTLLHADTHTHTHTLTHSFTHTHTIVPSWKLCTERG